MKRALVIGAGIAGPVVAIGLMRSGFEPTVYEAWSAGASSGVGSWLTVAVNGLRALHTFDLRDAVLDVSFPTPSVELYNGAGRLLGTVSLGQSLPDGTTTRTMKRPDLYRVLAEEAARRGVGFAHDKRLVQAETRTDGRVVARFADGAEAEGDVLIGADGVHSATRTIIDPHAPTPRTTGMGNVGGTTANPGLDVAPGTFRMMFGRRAFFGYAVHPSGDVWWYANPPVPYPPDPDGAWLAGLFDDDVGPAAALIRASTEPIVFSGQHELPTVPTWHRGAMVLVGDAAHVASPTSGQGASLAAEDAVALSLCLRDRPVPEAFAAYEAMRRSRVERIVAEAARMSTHKVPGRFGRFVRDLVLPMVLRHATRTPRDWLFEYRVPVQLGSGAAP